MEKEEENCDIYLKILNLPFSSNSYQSHDDVIRFSQEKPDEFLKQLLTERYYSIALDWISLNNFNERFSSEVSHILLLKLLDKDVPDFEGAKSILDDAENNKVWITIENLLNNTVKISVRRFLISYVLSRNSYQFKALDIWELQQELMGIILVEEVCHKTFDKSQLLSLINFPSLIMEQWILNLKLACVDKGIQKISSILNSVKCRNADNIHTISKQQVDCLCWEDYNLMIEKYAVKALKLSGTQISIHEMLTADDCEVQYVMPHQVPSKSDWEENASASVCPVCKIAVFSIFCRKHHCRRCGRVVCGDCSVFRHIVEGYGDVPMRVCEFCYRNMTESLSWDNDHLVNIDLSTEEESDTSENTSSDCNIGWYFTTDPSHNQCLREEFAFDFTPSLSVCHALFTLHRDDLRAALAILKLCHKSFEKVIDSISLNLHTVDRHYVIKIITTLLLVAKVRFGKLLNLEGISVCEYYKQWSNWVESLLCLNLLNLLPKGTLNNALEIGELKQLQLIQHGGEDLLLKNLKQEKIFLKVLRDKLVKTRNWDLALDICTKEGFDKLGVWKAHGVDSLQAEDFKTAREQFRKIFGNPKNKNFNTKIALLEEIVFCLEHKELVNEEVTPVPSLNTRSLKEYPLDAEKEKYEDVSSPFSSIYLKECDYYLRLYGSHQMYLEFLFKHKFFQESVKYCQQFNIDEVLFCDYILLPSFKLGYFEQLWSAVNNVDPKRVWMTSFSVKIYKYLSKTDNLPCLLEIFKFLKDNIAASKILLRMYKADCYKELFLLNSYLKEAKLLLDDYLNSILIEENEKNNELMYPISDVDNTNVQIVQKQILITDAQIYLTEFLSDLENSGMDFKSKIKLIQEILKQNRKVSQKFKNFVTEVPTLFDKEGRIIICVLLLCLEDFKENLSAMRALVDMKCLDAGELLSVTLQTRVKAQEFEDISLIIEDILSWNYIPAHCVKDCFWPVLTVKEPSLPEQKFAEIVKFLTEVEDKLDICIEVGQLKLAFYQINNESSVESMERLHKVAVGKGDRRVIQLSSKWLQNKRK